MAEKTLKQAILRSRKSVDPLHQNFSMSALMEQIAEETVAAAVENMRAELEEKFEEAFGELSDSMREKIDASVQKAIQESIAKQLKGDKGDAGNAPRIDIAALAEAAAALIPAPVINEESIAQKAARHVTVPIDVEAIAAHAASLISPPADGEPGKNGSPDAPEEVVEKIHQSKKKIGMEMIEGLPVFLKNIQRAIRESGTGKMIHGGGMTLAAAAGQTLTRNTNGTWTLVTGGFSTLTATETPNANIKIFTFSAATAKPSYIVSDNVWMRATSAAGGVNWTWNSGTKQATLTIPPTDDIFAIV